MTLYEVRVGYIETNYVERIFAVVADDPRGARTKAINGETVNEYEEITCEPIDRRDIKVIKAPTTDYTG